MVEEPPIAAEALMEEQIAQFLLLTPMA